MKKHLSRAEARRQQFTKEKAAKKERKAVGIVMKANTPAAKLAREQVKGMYDGRKLATSIVVNILHEQFSFRKKRLTDFLETVGLEVGKCSQEATLFNLNFYEKRLNEKIDKANVQVSLYDIKEHTYMMARERHFVESCAIMFLVLNQFFGFSTNMKGTGRTDLIMEYIVNEYIKILLDPQKHDAEFYYQKAKERTGLEF